MQWTKIFIVEAYFRQKSIHAAVPDFLDNVWFSDEAHFLLSGHVFFFLRMEVSLRVCMLYSLQKGAHNYNTRITAYEAWWGAGMRTRHNSLIQHVIAQCAVALFGPPQAVAALAHELSARFLAQGNNRRVFELLPNNCEASSLPKEPTGRQVTWTLRTTSSGVAHPLSTICKGHYTLWSVLPGLPSPNMA